MSQRILAISNKPLNLFCAIVMWITFFLLPGVSLAITPSAYEYFYFPYNVLGVLLIIGNGFFRAIMRHRIPGVRFIWPNPSAMGALISGVTLTVVCAITYFPGILWHGKGNSASAYSCFSVKIHDFYYIVQYCNYTLYQCV